MNNFTKNYTIPFIIGFIPSVIHNWWFLNWQWWVIVVPCLVAYHFIIDYYDNFKGDSYNYN